MNDMSESIALSEGQKIGGYQIASVTRIEQVLIRYSAKRLCDDRPCQIVELFPNPSLERDSDGCSVKGTTLEVASYLDEGFKWLREVFTSTCSQVMKAEHPNIVRFHDLIEANGTSYLVMDQPEGETLEQHLSARGKLPVEEVMSIVTPVLDGLTAVHEERVLHLGISPDAIVLTKTGPVLTGFGQTGTYQAPMHPIFDSYTPLEVIFPLARRKNVCTDLYSMAATMLRCVTGRTPPHATRRELGDDPHALTRGSGTMGSRKFHAAVCAAYVMNQDERVQTVEEWRDMLVRASARQPWWRRIFS